MSINELLKIETSGIGTGWECNALLSFVLRKNTRTNRHTHGHSSLCMNHQSPTYLRLPGLVRLTQLFRRSVILEHSTKTDLTIVLHTKGTKIHTNSSWNKPSQVTQGMCEDVTLNHTAVSIQRYVFGWGEWCVTLRNRRRQIYKVWGGEWT